MDTRAIVSGCLRHPPPGPLPCLVCTRCSDAHGVDLHPEPPRGPGDGGQQRRTARRGRPPVPTTPVVGPLTTTPRGARGGQGGAVGVCPGARDHRQRAAGGSPRAWRTMRSAPPAGPGRPRRRPPSASCTGRRVWTSTRPWARSARASGAPIVRPRHAARARSGERLLRGGKARASSSCVELQERHGVGRRHAVEDGLGPHHHGGVSRARPTRPRRRPPHLGHRHLHQTASSSSRRHATRPRAPPRPRATAAGAHDGTVRVAAPTAQGRDLPGRLHWVPGRRTGAKPAADELDGGVASLAAGELVARRAGQQPDPTRPVHARTRPARRGCPRHHADRSHQALREEPGPWVVTAAVHHLDGRPPLTLRAHATGATRRPAAEDSSVGTAVTSTHGAPSRRARSTTTAHGAPRRRPLLVVRLVVGVEHDGCRDTRHGGERRGTRARRPRTHRPGPPPIAREQRHPLPEPAQTPRHLGRQLVAGGERRGRPPTRTLPPWTAAASHSGRGSAPGARRTHRRRARQRRPATSAAAPRRVGGRTGGDARPGGPRRDPRHGAHHRRCRRRAAGTTDTGPAHRQAAHSASATTVGGGPHPRTAARGRRAAPRAGARRRRRPPSPPPADPWSTTRTWVPIGTRSASGAGTE